MTSPNFIWVLLAAGGSTRLGQPKQLLSLGGKTLIEHQISNLLATELPVCVISGAVALAYLANQQQHINWPTTEAKTQSQPPYPALQIIHNKNWQQGMGSSVILAQQSFPASHIGWVLVDQYAITTEQILNFYRTWQQAPSPALVSHYNNQATNNNHAWGVPVITHKNLMAEISAPERGLKPWLLANHHKLKWQFYAWPEARINLDTQAQWQAIQQQRSWHVAP